MKSRWWVILSLTFLLAVSSTATVAAKGEKGSRKKTTGDQIREVFPESQAVFSEQERVLIKGWFDDNLDGLPPGLAKRGTLPPGLEKQLQKRGTLPPGLQKKIQPLPLELERQLRRLPAGYRRVVVDGNVILMNQETALIYDIVRSVIP
jgi:hypothetical protein